MMKAIDKSMERRKKNPEDHSHCLTPLSSQVISSDNTSGTHLQHVSLYYKKCEADSSADEIANLLKTYATQISSYQLTTIRSRSQLEEISEEEIAERFSRLVDDSFPVQTLSIAHSDYRYSNLEESILRLGWKKMEY